MKSDFVIELRSKPLLDWDKYGFSGAVDCEREELETLKLKGEIGC
jgi:hypothetical protein